MPPMRHPSSSASASSAERKKKLSPPPPPPQQQTRRGSKQTIDHTGDDAVGGSSSYDVVEIQNDEEEGFGSFTSSTVIAAGDGATPVSSSLGKGNPNKNGEILSSLNEEEHPEGLHDKDDKNARRMQQHNRRARRIIPALIVCLGAAACAAFVALGITSENDDREKEAQARALLYPSYFLDVLELYEMAGLWAHQAVQHQDLPLARERFREMYQHIRSTGLQPRSIEYLPRVTHADRERYENETRSYLASLPEEEGEYPNLNYTGFTGLEYLPNGRHKRLPRSNQSFYFVQHYVEPLKGNERELDYDAYSSKPRREAIESALTTHKPSLSRRLGHATHDYSFMMIHPGRSPHEHKEGHDDHHHRHHNDIHRRGLDPEGIDVDDVVLTKFHFNLQEFLLHVIHLDPNHMNGDIYLFDTTPGVEGWRQYLVGIHCLTDVFLPEISINETRSGRWKHSATISAMSNRQWTVVVIQDGNRMTTQHVYIVLGGIIIFVACLSLALWVHTDSGRAHNIHRLKQEAEQERAQLMVASANQAARAERELNDYVAHEVRNPLAAAISAHSFVRSEVGAEQPLATPESISSVRDDVSIIGNSLHFINDLLRSMLDTSRASTNRLEIEAKPMDIKSDVLEPVHSMLYLRDLSKVQVLVDCPDNLIISSDCLRLKQVVLNLARNSSKFVETGYIRLRAEVVETTAAVVEEEEDENVRDEEDLNGGNQNGIPENTTASCPPCTKTTRTVRILVQDSGPGVPPEKRAQLFSKFQSSLDSLNQGTGIGLSLSKKLVDLMGMELWLDEAFDSGVEGAPGASFVIDTNVAPEDHAELPSENGESDAVEKGLLGQTQGNSNTPKEEDEEQWELPSKLSVLFVDDDMILRKLFARTIRKVAPDWTIQEASNGETALKMVEERQSSTMFDVIFMDQYMASVEQQLLGTETVRALRARGVTSIICGLSANDIREGFEEAGADGFIFKPFPTEPVALRKELRRLVKPLLVPVVVSKKEEDGTATTTATTPSSLEDFHSGDDSCLMDEIA